MAGVPAEGVSAVAPIDLVPNRVGVNDDADTASTISARQHGVADHRGTRTASDNHDRGPGLRCPWWPRDRAVPGAWTVSIEDPRERLIVMVAGASLAGNRMGQSIRS